jgi:hypothetical protein
MLEVEKLDMPNIKEFVRCTMNESGGLGFVSSHQVGRY